MKRTIFIAILAFNLALTALSSLIYSEDLKALFENWKQVYNIQYENSEAEEKRFDIFIKNYHAIEEWNKDPTKTSSVALNKFADLTNEEFGKMYIGNHIQPKANHNPPQKSKRFLQREPSVLKLATNNIPSNFDWRDKDVVSSVKDQGSCASSWAFSSLSAMES